jgi:hypothetical protein
MYGSIGEFAGMPLITDYPTQGGTTRAPRYTVRGPIELPAQGYLKYCIDREGLTVATVNYRADTTPVEGFSLGHVDMGASATTDTWREFVDYVEDKSGVRIAQYQAIRDTDALDRFLSLF